MDLFVRPSNTNAVSMYEGMGYSVYRRVREYYQGGGENGKDEDGYGELIFLVFFFFFFFFFGQERSQRR